MSDNSNDSDLSVDVIKKVKTVKKRPKFNLTTIGKLIEAFQKDYSVENACAYAEVSRQTYYTWLEKYPAFAKEMEDAQQYLIKKANVAIATAIKDGDLSTVRWFAERRDPRFKAKGELEVLPGQRKVEEKLRGFMNDTNDDAYAADSANDGSAQSTAAIEPGSGDDLAPSAPDIS